MHRPARSASRRSTVSHPPAGSRATPAPQSRDPTAPGRAGRSARDVRTATVPRRCPLRRPPSIRPSPAACPPPAAAPTGHWRRRPLACRSWRRPGPGPRATGTAPTRRTPHRCRCRGHADGCRSATASPRPPGSRRRPAESGAPCRPAHRAAAPGWHRRRHRRARCGDRGVRRSRAGWSRGPTVRRPR